MEVNVISGKKMITQEAFMRLLLSINIHFISRDNIEIVCYVFAPRKTFTEETNKRDYSKINE